MFRVGDVIVGGSRVVLIAEVGVNHLRDLQLAGQLISAAARAGADIVKFQNYSAETLVTRDAPRYWTWSGEAAPEGGQFDSFKRLETPEASFARRLQELCAENGVEFMSTPFDEHAVEVLLEVGVNAFKIASGDLTNLPLLRHVGRAGLPVFLSTGGSDLAEVEAAVGALEESGVEDLCVMQCTLCYPTRPDDANLSAITELATTFPGRVLGLSDHTLGPNIGAGSVLLGADVIEKHFTTDRGLPDSADHWLSADEAELKQLRVLADTFRLARGNGRKGVLPCEGGARANARRSLVARGRIGAGNRFSEENVTTKRPATGISPTYFDALIGLTAARDIEDDEVIEPSHVVEDGPFKPISEESATLFRP
mgnify:CR=1 FL=1